jgi:Co/Zn/Cd efflux system component
MDDHRHGHSHGRSHDHGHRHDGNHSHSHGIIDPSITTSDRGLWAVKWSFVGLAVTAVLQLAVVFVSGSVALLADTIHNFPVVPRSGAVRPSPTPRGRPRSVAIFRPSM